jgi:hypothetical protein
MELTTEARMAAIELLGDGRPYNAMQLCWMVGTLGHGRFDWHEYAALLGEMQRCGVVRFLDNNGPDGFSRYQVIKQ